jgi:hypothetical protein
VRRSEPPHFELAPELFTAARPSPLLSTEGLLALLTKYEQIERLRVAHLSPNEPNPQRAMASLAAAFPGSLRELDELPMHEIRARIVALQSATLAPESQARWMIATGLFHGIARGALAAKRWLAGRKDVNDELRASFLRAAVRMRYADDTCAWADDLARIASPPRGRLMDLVFERLAERLGTRDVDTRGLVFGTRERARGGRGSP